MARTYSRPGRMLAALGVIIFVLIGMIAAGVNWSNAQWTPKLALDLDGGTEFVLKAVPTAGQEGQVTDATMAEAVNIIRQRVNGSGVSEAEVTTQGKDSIVVSLPGRNVDQATKDSIQRSAEMQFRAVLYVLDPQPVTSPSPTGAAPSGSSSASAKPSAGASAKPTAGASAKPTAGGASAKPTAAGSASSNGGGLKLATPSAAATAKPTSASTTSPSPAASAGGTAGASGGAGATPSPAKSPTDASDTAWLETPGLDVTFAKTDCSTPAGRTAAQDVKNDPKKPLIVCDEVGSKYALGPVEVFGRDISGASAGLSTNSQGQSTGQWVVNLEFDSTGASEFGKVTARIFPLQPPRNRFAIVLDNQVVSAPSANAVISDGRAEISGNFTQQSATALANQLKFGALPISFDAQTETDIAATLGAQYLKNGLLAGLIGLLLVVLYSLLQYRALGLVTVGSLIVAGLLTYLVVVFLGWRQGYRLSLAGIVGLIVAIGITADSFIVYFERIRDEVREGRSLTAAVELAWNRAKRTILISDAVSFLAALVLYVLAIGNVKGFAFTLGLTTLVDVLVVFLFTKPIVTLLARSRFFGSGHRLSGFDAAHLGRQVHYTGRGTTRPPRVAKADRVAAERDEDFDGSLGPIQESESTADLADVDEPKALTSGQRPQRSTTTIAERRAAERRERERAGSTAVMEENE